MLTYVFITGFNNYQVRLHLLSFISPSVSPFMDYLEANPRHCMMSFTKILECFSKNERFKSL